MLSGAASSLTDNDGTIDPKNFATIRTTSIVQRQQKEHLHEEMHDQMSGYKRLRRDHQAALARLEEQCRQEMEKHKQMLDREYEQLLTQFSRELERLQVHNSFLGKKTRLKSEIFNLHISFINFNFSRQTKSLFFFSGLTSFSPRFQFLP